MEQIPKKIMTKFIYKLKKLSFCPICGLFSLFLAKNIKRWSSALHNFIWVSDKTPKFQKNQWSNSKKMSGQMDGWIARRTGRLCFIGIFQTLHGYKNYLSFSTLYIYFLENISKKWLYSLSQCFYYQYVLPHCYQ